MRKSLLVLFVSVVMVFAISNAASARSVRIEPDAANANSVMIEESEAFSLAGLHYHPVTPCRAYDTPYGALFTFDMVIRGFCGIPEEAQAITFTVAAWQPTAQGNLLFWQGGAKPLAVTLNFHPSVVASTGGVVWLCERATNLCEFDFLGQTTQELTRMIFDVTGYYAAE